MCLFNALCDRYNIYIYIEAFSRKRRCYDIIFLQLLQSHTTHIYHTEAFDMKHHSSHCSTTCVTKAVVCVILSVG